MMSSSKNPNWEQSLQDVLNIFALVASDTFELFYAYSILPADDPETRNKLILAALQTKTQCDKLLSFGNVTRLPENRQSLLEISENLENLAQFFQSFSKNAPLPQDIFSDLRVPVGRVAKVCDKVKQSTQALLRELDPSARGRSLRTLLEILKEKLRDLFKWCMANYETIAGVLEVGGVTLSKVSNSHCKVAGMVLQGGGELLRNVGPRFKEQPAPAANGGSRFTGDSERNRQEISSVCKGLNADCSVGKDARECNEYARDQRDDLEQIAEATRRSLQISDCSARSPSASPAQEPLLSRHSQNLLVEQLGGSSKSEPKPKSAEAYNATAAGEASFRTSCSRSQSENDLDIAATVPKSKSWAGECPDEASASFASSAASDRVAQCSLCRRPHKSHRFVCLLDHDDGDTGQVFCDKCIHKCPPEHAQLLVRNSRPLASRERERFDFLHSNNCFNLASNDGAVPKQNMKCISCEKHLDDEVCYKCIECPASELCADCLLNHGEHCEMYEEINKSHHAFLVLRQGTSFNYNTFRLLF